MQEAGGAGAGATRSCQEAPRVCRGKGVFLLHLRISLVCNSCLCAHMGSVRHTIDELLSCALIWPDVAVTCPRTFSWTIYATPSWIQLKLMSHDWGLEAFIPRRSEVGGWKCTPEASQILYSNQKIDQLQKMDACDV